jgi:hypothetical protein
VLSLDVGLRDDKRKALVVRETFTAQAVPENPSVDAAAAAMSVAFSQVCGQLIAHLSESAITTSEVGSAYY